jgi:hypothetical protein
MAAPLVGVLMKTLGASMGSVIQILHYACRDVYQFSLAVPAFSFVQNVVVIQLPSTYTGLGAGLLDSGPRKLTISLPVNRVYTWTVAVFTRANCTETRTSGLQQAPCAQWH